MQYYKINENNTLIEIDEKEYIKLKNNCDFIFETEKVGIVDLFRDQVGPIVQGAIIESSGKSYIAKQIKLNVAIM